MLVAERASNDPDERHEATADERDQVDEAVGAVQPVVEVEAVQL